MGALSKWVVMWIPLLLRGISSIFFIGATHVAVSFCAIWNELNRGSPNPTKGFLWGRIVGGCLRALKEATEGRTETVCVRASQGIAR